MLPLALAVAAQAAATPKAPAPEPRLLRQPSIHGDTIVFVHAGDLWVTTIHGGVARRLTSGPGPEGRPKISPDGKTVAFTGTYDGANNADVYTIPIEGGEPKRITFDPQQDLVLGWTPGGRIAYASTYGSPTVRKSRLWTVAAAGGMPQATTVDEIGEGSFMDDDTLVYNRFDSSFFNWRRYRGGTQGRVSIYSLSSHKYRELPAGREQYYWPLAVGRTVVYASDKRLATLNLYQYDLDTGKETQLTAYSDEDVRFPSTDGKRVAFERDGRLYTLDLATKAVEPVRPVIEAENLQARPTLRRLQGSITGLSLSPSGARVLVEARGDLFTVPVREGDTRNLTETPGARERFPAWSPDAKSIAFLREDDKEPRLLVRPAAGGVERLILPILPPNVTGLDWSPDSKYVVVSTRQGSVHLVDVAAKTIKTVAAPLKRSTSYDFSPDGKWIALSMGRANNLNSLYLYEVATGALSPITNGYYNDTDVSFSLDGKYLYFLSERTFDQPQNAEEGFDLTVQDATRAYILPLAAGTPNPLVAPDEEEPTGAGPGKRPDDGSGATKVDLDGIAARAIPLPLPAGSYLAIEGLSDGVLVVSPEGVLKYDLDDRQIQPILAGFPGAMVFNASRTKMAIYNGLSLRVVDVRPGIPAGFGAVALTDVAAVVDPRAEWREIFWESWRWYRDNYYDPNLRGLDWPAIGRRYAAYLPYVDHRSDLNEVIGRMISELGTGHSYVSGGDLGNVGPAIPIGLLGADYRLEGNRVVFARILRGDAADERRRGPLVEAGAAIKEGDTLLAIDGKPVDAANPPESRLVNKVGKYVTLTVSRSGGAADARTVRVMPMADETALRYAVWVEGNRRRVSELSGGRIAYIHVPDTGQEGAAEFVRGYRAQTDKDALIVDERDNSGGNLPTFFIDRLSQTATTRIRQRNGADDPAGVVSISGPKVMLINQNSGSGGDMFPYLFRKAGLGPLIGVRTWGGLVGYSEPPAPLVDGGSLTVPEFSIYDPTTDRIVAENTGIDPDIEVDDRPDLVAQGRDPQLEKAVEVLLEKLRTLPAPAKRGLPTVGDKGRVAP